MEKTGGTRIMDVIRNIGSKGIIALLLVFVLTVGATCVGGYLLYKSTKESIELQGRLNAVQSAKEYDEYLIIRENTVILAGHVVDEMIRENQPTSEILDYLTAESLSIKKSIDMDYTGLYGWINGEYCDGVGWVPDEDYVPTERPWYVETVADRGDITFVSPYLDEQTGTVLTTMSELLSDGVSVIALDVTLSRIQEITEKIAVQTPGSYGIVLDRTGQVIAHSDRDELGKNYLEEKDTLGAELAGHLFEGKEGQFELSHDGQKYIVFTETIEGGWKAATLINTDVFYRPLKIIFPILALLMLLEALVFLSVIYNQSERNLAIASAREAQSANLAKTKFLSQMSHEIRTPINAIIGLDSIMLRDETISQQSRESLEKIDSSAKHLLALINDILDMSRIESGRVELREKVFSLKELLDQINVIAGGQCEDKRLSYECVEDGPHGEYYAGDDLKIKQVLINILGNAVKFTEPPGSVRLRVEETDASEGKCSLRFTVSDTGAGMDREYLDRIFEAFSQEDETMTNKYGGSGLGMAITKRMVDMMGGEILVESEKGVGSTFTVTVPLKRASAEDLKADSPQEDAAAQIPVAGMHVLIAEDQEINAEVLTDLLEMEEITSEWAENGKIAVEMFSQSDENRFDAILMDMRMPEMDGLEATRTIRALDRADAGTVPIIALSANAFEEDVKQCLQAGMNEHLSKPVDIEALKQTLGRLRKK